MTSLRRGETKYRFGIWIMGGGKVARKYVPRTYAAKYSAAIKKKIGISKPQTWAGKYGSTSKYSTARIIRRGSGR